MPTPYQNTFQQWAEDTVYRPWERLTGPHGNNAALYPPPRLASAAAAVLHFRGSPWPFLTSTLVRSAFGPRPELICPERVWRSGVAELRRRAGGYRESGAFLLGGRDRGRRIEEFVYYDDIDPNALATGIVVIDGRKLGKLWAHCRDTGRSVIADIHVHPGGFSQSGSDQANPIIAEVGHLALILPDCAARRTRPGAIGVYEYLGARSWKDRSFERASPFHVGWWPRWR